MVERACPFRTPGPANRLWRVPEMLKHTSSTSDHNKKTKKSTAGQATTCSVATLGVRHRPTPLCLGLKCGPPPDVDTPMEQPRPAFGWPSSSLWAKVSLQKSTKWGERTDSKQGADSQATPAAPQ